MKRHPRGLSYLLALGSLTLSSIAWAADSGPATEAFAAGTTAFAQQDYLLALSHFQDARAHGLDGPAIHYNLGVCQYKLGNYREADAAFHVVADNYPAMRALAHYNLGLVALKRGQQARAQTFFEQARANSVDEKIARLAAAELQKLEPARETQSWFSLVDARIGHDDNVSLQDDIGLPTGGSDSAFTEVFAMLSGPAGPGLRFDGSVYAVRYPDAETFDQNALRLGGVYQWTWGTWRAEAGPYLNYSTLNGDGYEQRLGGSLALKRDLDDRTTVSVRYLHDEIDELEDQFAFVGGSRDQLRVSLDRSLNKGRLALGYVLDLNDREGASVSPTRHRVFGRYRFSVTPYWLIDAELSFRTSRYDDLMVTRDEDLTELSLGFLRTLAKSWQLTGEYHLGQNDSNVDTFSYDRNRFLIGLTKLF